MNAPGRKARHQVPLHAPLWLVALIAAAGMVRVLTQHWRQGAVLLGAALLVAAALRVLLADDRAGLLAIRSRVIDVLSYSGFGVVIIVLALTITRGSLSG
ncbi:DUF3017 domain-containing protein [Pseudonocardia sp. GCM10023141]|uniref:DUF3017 domain-containing protein n=1 Tax=Pseudonocardia sp. GCM10023141 TaxID=3252653 RepID=UPI0036202B3E